MTDNELLIERFNALDAANACRDAERFCGSSTWCNQFISQRPLNRVNDLHKAADSAFDKLRREDWLEAFAHHPKIGDIDSLRMKYQGNRQWSAGEQSGIAEVDEATLNSLAAANLAYETKFGFIFIVCATGKSAAEMLGLLQVRLVNNREQELANAAGQQRLITHLRIDKWLTPT